MHNSIPYPNPYNVLLHAYDRMKIEDSYGQHIYIITEIDVKLNKWQ